MSVHAKINPIFHAWYTYIKKIYKKKIKVKIAIEKFWCVKYYKAAPYNMEHTLCVCVKQESVYANPDQLKSSSSMEYHKY